MKSIEGSQSPKLRRCPACKLSEGQTEFTLKGKRCRRCEREYHAEWYRKNKAREMARVTEWAKNNKDKVREYGRTSRLRNLASRKAAGKKWRDENKKKMAELKLNWRKSNPQKDAEYNHKRRCRGGNASSSDIKEVFDRDGHTCLNCGSRDRLSIDHIIPLSKGGLNDKDNLQCLCLTCNLSKGAKTIDYRETQP